jgi:Prp8 binding protein
MSSSLKRNLNDNSSSLVPVVANKKARNEIIAYAAQNNKDDDRTSSLLAPIMSLVGQEGEILCCKFSPDGVTLASAGYDRKVYLWNVYGECENWAVMPGHGGVIMEIKFNYDGTELMSCSTDKTICIWDLTSCERVKRLKGHSSFVNSIDVSKKDSRLICSGSDDATVKVWDRRKKGHVFDFDSKFPVLSVAFNENGDQIFSSGIDNEIKVWDTRKNDIIYKMKGHTDSPTGLSLSPNGAYLASNSMDNTS